jgi:hypothetical protein
VDRPFDLVGMIGRFWNGPWWAGIWDFYDIGPNLGLFTMARVGAVSTFTGLCWANVQPKNVSAVRGLSYRKPNKGLTT